MKDDLSYEETHIAIVDGHIKKLKNKEIALLINVYYSSCFLYWCRLSLCRYLLYWYHLCLGHQYDYYLQLPHTKLLLDLVIDSC